MSRHCAPYSLCIGLALVLAEVAHPPSAAAADEPRSDIASPFRVVENPIGPQAGLSLNYDATTSYTRLRALFDAGAPFRITGFPLANSRRVDLTLRPVSVTSPGASAVVVREDGTGVITPQVVTFSGRLTDDPRSYVFLALSPNMVNGQFVDRGVLYFLSSGRPGMVIPGEALLAEASACLAGGPVDCALSHVSDCVAPVQVAMPLAPHPARGAGEPKVRVADLFIEADDFYTAQFSSAQDAADYAIILLTAISDIYRRDLGVELRLPDGYLRVWETQPPWEYAELSALQAYWDSASNPLQHIDRAAVHLLTEQYGGGIAYQAALCSHAYGYGISGTIGHFPMPLPHVHPDNGDPLVLAHELGHNFGAGHTFDFNPPIECVDGSGPDEGTIMSYCPSVGMRFHGRVQQVIRGFLEPLSCLEVIDLVPGDYNHDEILDQADLDAATMCINLEFAAAGCLETFDLNEDGRLTPCDYDALARVIDPGLPIEDCNTNGQHDCDDITAGLEEDCNGNGVPDSCDITGGAIGDCNSNGIPDDCEDCNENGLADECDLAAGTSQDCQPNGSPDECDIAEEASEDFNGNGVPDECEPHLGTIYVSIADANCSAAGPGTPSEPFCDIQDGLDAALSTDVVLVADGTYTGPGNRNLSFGGRSITLRSQNGPQGCVIDAQGEGRAFHFRDGETAAARLEGFTIINGYVAIGSSCGGTGGAILCDVSSPTIANCILSGNTAFSYCSAHGGAITVRKSTSTIVNCMLVGNNAMNGYGGGIYALDSAPVIRNCAIIGNASRSGGAASWNVTSGGQYLGYCPTFHNCTIVGNNADSRGGGIYAGWSGEPALSNSIVWGNAAPSRPQISDSGNLTVTHSDVQGGWPGAGNLDRDPLFVDLDGPDGILGTEDDDPHLSATSPCINAGDLAFVPGLDETDLDGEPRLQGGFVDLGADETPYSHWDADWNGHVDLVDFTLLADCLSGPGAAPVPTPPTTAEDCRRAFDLNGDGDVDIPDFAAFEIALAEW